MNNLKRAGATAVEFAIALPILMLVIFGGVEITRVAMLRHTANHAAYSAARDAIIPGADSASVIQTAENHLAIIGVKNAVVTLDPATITDSTKSIGVTVTFPVAGNSLVVPKFMSGDLIGRSRLMTERSGAQMSANLPEPPAPPPPVTPPTPPDDDDDDDDNDDPPPPPPPPPML